MVNSRAESKASIGEEIHLGPPYQVILFNDEQHAMDEVVAQIVMATGFSIDKAMTIMLEAHHTGRAVVIVAHQERCEYVAQVLEEIRLGVKVEPAQGQ